MSLFGSIQLAGNTLQAMQIGLNVVGNNIANANTPGFVRERVLYQPAPVQQIANLTLGSGVEIAGIVQSVDKFVENRLRDAGSDVASADVQEKVYRDLQSILGELSDSDISTSLSNFFNAVDLVTQTPEDVAIRGLAVRNGEQLTVAVNTLDRRVRTVHQDFNQRVGNIADEINTLTEQIRQLNLKIVVAEGSRSTGSDAGGLRSQRNVALKKLSQLVDIKVSERDTGVVNVSTGSEFLVFEGANRQVKSVQTSNDGLLKATIKFADNNNPLSVSGGELGGIYESRDTIVGGFLNRLDEFAASLANKFNQVFSQGQGVTGFSEVTSAVGVADPALPLDAAGLNFTPVNGSFDVLVRTKSQNPNDPPLTTPTTVSVDLNGLDGDLTLNGLVQSLDAIDGISAKLSPDNELVIRSESSDIDFSFSGDTSGVLAALGINTFFTGSTAGDLGVNNVLKADGSKFAASLSGIGVGVENALNLINLNDQSLNGSNGETIGAVYDQLINETTQGATITASIADGLRTFESSLDASSQAVSGVNLDEEAVNMIFLQRTFQASARYISTLSDLLDTLINL